MKQLRRLLLLLASVFVLTCSQSASAAHPVPVRTDAWNLHHGTTVAKSSRGPRVALLQFLIRNPRPKANVFTRVTGTLKRGTFTKGLYGHSTAAAVVAYKFRIGVPARGQCGAKSSEWRATQVGPYFISILRGRKRPACWVAVAARRLAAAKAGATPEALKLKNIELSQVGVYEPEAFARYNGYFHLPAEAWCAIFQNWSRVHIGLPVLGAQNPWYVPSIIAWGQAHGYLIARAEVGEFVLYYGDISHIGYVIKVDPKTGYYWTVEGNWASHVAEVQHSPYDHLHYFLAIPGLVR